MVDDAGNVTYPSALIVGSLTASNVASKAELQAVDNAATSHFALVGSEAHGLGDISTKSTNDFTSAEAFTAFTQAIASIIAYSPTGTLGSAAYESTTNFASASSQLVMSNWVTETFATTGALAAVFDAIPTGTLSSIVYQSPTNFASAAAFTAFTQAMAAITLHSPTGALGSAAYYPYTFFETNGAAAAVKAYADATFLSEAISENVLIHIPTGYVSETAYMDPTNFTSQVAFNAFSNWVNTLVTNVFVDALIDGLSYWRKDGGWTNAIVLPVPASREVLLTVTPNTNNISAVSIFTRADAGQELEIGGVRNTVGNIPQPGDTKETALELVNGTATNFLAVDWATEPVASVGRRGGARRNLATESYVTNAIAGITNTGGGITLADSTNATMNLLTNGAVNATFNTLWLIDGGGKTQLEVLGPYSHLRWSEGYEGSFYGDGGGLSNIPLSGVIGAISNIIVNGTTGAVANGMASITNLPTGSGGGMDTNAAGVIATNAVNDSNRIMYPLATTPTTLITRAMGNLIKLDFTTNVTSLGFDKSGYSTNQPLGVTLHMNLRGFALAFNTNVDQFVASSTAVAVIPTNGWFTLRCDGLPERNTNAPNVTVRQ